MMYVLCVYIYLMVVCVIGIVSVFVFGWFGVIFSVFVGVIVIMVGGVGVYLMMLVVVMGVVCVVLFVVWWYILWLLCVFVLLCEGEEFVCLLL